MVVVREWWVQCVQGKKRTALLYLRKQPTYDISDHVLQKKMKIRIKFETEVTS